MTYYQQQLTALYQKIGPDPLLRQRLEQARLLMHQRVGEPLALADLAAAAAFSPSHFLRLFVRYYGRTPHRYLVSVRLSKAKALLRAGLPVAAVCAEIGMESPSTFTTLFRKMTGRTPGTYSRQLAD